MKIGIVLGSIRENRFGQQVADWVMEQVAGRDDAEHELIDLKSFDVPLLTSPVHPMRANKQYDSEGTQRWSAAIDACDAYVFVTAEYNHSVPGPFKNAVDSLGPEWVGKPVGFISYGSIGGHRAVEAWRQSLANFSMHDVRPQIGFAVGLDYEMGGELKPIARRAEELDGLLSELVALSGRLAD